MSTAVDTAFEAIVTSGDADMHHAVCGICFPGTIVPAGTMAICGYRFDTTEPVIDATGLHKCAKCLAFGVHSVFPCGH